MKLKTFQKKKEKLKKYLFEIKEFNKYSWNKVLYLNKGGTMCDKRALG